MSPLVDSDLVSQLAVVAGFRFSPDRCRALAPELDWLLAQAVRIRELSRVGEEPVSVFHPASSATTPAGMDDARHG